MADIIYLEGMNFFGYHGVFATERELGQRFVVDVALTCDLEAAGISDDLAQTVDYSQVYKTIQSLVEGTPSKLIEHLAQQIAQQLLANFAIASVRVKVHKPNAPLPGPVTDVAVEITRSRGTGRS